MSHALGLRGQPPYHTTSGMVHWRGGWGVSWIVPLLGVGQRSGGTHGVVPGAFLLSDHGDKGVCV